MKSASALRQALPALLCALAIIFLDFSFMLWQPLPAKRLDSIIYDWWMTARQKTPPHPAPVIVEIDEKSLQELGQWPWARDVLGKLVNKLLAANAAAVGIDVLLKEPDRTSGVWLQKQAAEEFGIELDLGALPEQVRNRDLFFRDSIAGKPVVIGAYADFDANAHLPPELPKPTGLAERTPSGAPSPRDTIIRAQGMLTPLQDFSDAAAVALINASVQTDGTIRSTPLLIRIADNIYAALGLRTLMAALGRKTLRLDSNQDGLASLKVGDFVAPVNTDGSFQPVFLGPGRTFPYFSASDVLSGRIGADELADRIVFIGATAAGLGDRRATAFDPLMPGVEVHATVVDNILTGKSIIMPAWSLGFQTCAICGSVLLSALIFGLLPVLAALFCGLLLLAAWLWLCWHFFNSGLFVSPLYAWAGIAAVAMLFLPWRFWREARLRLRLRRAFSRYVSPKVVRSIVSKGLDPLAGDKRTVSILFTDVRGFTGISEKLASNELVSLLNSYFTPMTECVTSREGTLDKFIGDAMMAFWNAPVSVPNHELKAVQAAMEMQQRLARLRPELFVQYGVEMRMGVGIHCGEARVGNMGSRDLLDYTCIGRNVNMASRLEGLCKYYGVGIIVSATIQGACGGQIRFVYLDRVMVKGSDEPVRIYTPVYDENMPDAAVLANWEQAQDLYARGEFDAAKTIFAQLRENPLLGKAVAVFLGRCESLRKQGQEWNGVWRHDSK